MNELNLLDLLIEYQMKRQIILNKIEEAIELEVLRRTNLIEYCRIKYKNELPQNTKTMEDKNFMSFRVVFIDTSNNSVVEL